MSLSHLAPLGPPDDDATCWRLLDLFCGSGGCSLGYARAGFEVTGVDIEPRHRYPFADLVQGDAMLVLADVDYCRSFDAIHASPPCQAYSVTAARWGRQDSDEHPRLVEPVREALQAIGRPYVIENVVGAPLLDPVLICGAAFGLGALCRDQVFRPLRRHRLFESNVPLEGTGCACWAGAEVIGVYGHGGGTRVGARGFVGTVAESREALDAPWMRRDDLAQAIPPAYTEWVGAQLLHHLDAKAAR